MIVYKVLLHGFSGSFVTDSIDDAINGVREILEEQNVGDVITVSITEMSKEELDNLPEFEGD